MEIGRLIFILNSSVVAIAESNGKNESKIYCEVKSYGFEKSTPREIVILAHSTADTTKNLLEKVLMAVGSVKT